MPPRPAIPSGSVSELHRELQSIHRLLAAHHQDLAALRQLQREWLQFQSTLTRLVHLIDGNGRPPIAERILILEEHARRWDRVDAQIDGVKFRLIGLLIGVTLSLIAVVFSLIRA